jgi:hypothetical protein
VSDLYASALNAEQGVSGKEGAMRCPKCGYVSFDYLPKCKKCSRDLTDVRQLLNLLDLKPAVPFLLGSLVGEGHEGGGQRAPLSLSQETDLEFAGLDMGGSESPEETMDLEGLEATVDIGSLGAEDGAEPEAASLDLSLEDLGEKGEEEGKVPQEDEGFLGLEIALDEDESPGNLAALAESEMDSGSAAQAPGDELELEELTFGEEEHAKESELELDLSDGELSELAKTLQGELLDEKGAKKPQDDMSAAELEKAMREMEEDL